MPTDAIKRKRIRYTAVPNEIKAELIKRGLSIRYLARKYGVSHFQIGLILAGWKFTRRGKWQKVKEQLLKDYPWLKAYIGN